MKLPRKRLRLPKRLPAVLFILAALGLAAAAAAGPEAGFSVVTGPGTTSPAPDTARCEFGRLSAKHAAMHTFRLRNDSGVPLTLYNLRSSCGCTSAVVGGAKALPVTVPPGRSLTLRVTLDTSALSPGFVDKTVWVEAYAPSGPVPAVQLEITGTAGPATVASSRPGPPAFAGAAPLEAQAAPVFALTDTAGHRRSLAEFRGHPVALFFFCGCPWCADCARQWAGVRAGAVPAGTQALVVFSGNAASARRFAAETGLDKQQTIVLADPALAVTERRYRLNTCPRVFALDAAGIIRYTNTHSDDAARVAPAAAIISRTTAALAGQF